QINRVRNSSGKSFSAAAEPSVTHMTSIGFVGAVPEVEGAGAGVGGADWGSTEVGSCDSIVEFCATAIRREALNMFPCAVDNVRATHNVAVMSVPGFKVSRLLCSYFNIDFRQKFAAAALSDNTYRI